MKLRSRSLALLSLTMLNAACGNMATSDQAGNQVSDTTTLSEETTAQATVATPRTIKIRSIGDILIHDALYYDADQGDGTYNFDKMFAPVKQYIENADITTANLEVIAAGDYLPLSSYPTFNAPSELIDALQVVGVDIVNNANNHTMDMGAEGALYSLDALDERGMPYVGSYRDWEDYATPRILEANGVKVGFLAYSYGANGNYIPEDMTHLLTLIDTDVMAEEVAALKEQVDLSVVMIHNGEEYETLPAAYQAGVANVARDAGANFILGGHPHVPQPFIVYNKQQAGIFSHGNFLSGQVTEGTKVGGIVEYVFTEGPEGFEVTSLKFMPTYNLGDYTNYGWQVVPLADWETYGIWDGQALFDDLVNRMRYYSNVVEVVEYLD